jgi:hypothetical protein
MPLNCQPIGNLGYLAKYGKQYGEVKSWSIVCLQSQLLDSFNRGGAVRALPSLRSSNKSYGRVVRMT